MRTGVGAATAVVLALVTTTACGGPTPSTALPTFPTPAAVESGPGEGSSRAGVPARCEQLLTGTDLGALLGLPLDSVELLTTVHVPQPAVGRTARIACRYSGIGQVRGPLLELDVSAYTDPTAATEQWRVNVADEDGNRREVPIGSASAVLVERAREAVLRVVHGSSNLTFVLPTRQLPAGRSRGEALVDLALRVLPVVVPASTTPISAVPARAAETQS